MGALLRRSYIEKAKESLKENEALNLVIALYKKEMLKPNLLDLFEV